MIENSTTQKQEISNPAIKDNGGWAILTLFLIFTNALTIQLVLNSLTQDNRTIISLWEPDGLVLIFTVATFIFVSVVSIWMIATKDSQMKFIFKRAAIIITVLYIIFVIIMCFLIAVGNTIRN